VILRKRAPRHLSGWVLALPFCVGLATLLVFMGARQGLGATAPGSDSEAVVLSAQQERIPPPTPTLPPTPRPTPTPLPLPTAPPLPTPLPIPPAPDPWIPAGNESVRDAKLLGAQVAELLTTYDADSSLSEIALSVAGSPGRADALVEAAQPLHHPGQWSRGTVEYAQMGGLLNGKASIMVVVRQDLGTTGAVESSVTRTIDVRLRNLDGRWTFDELAHAGGEPVARPADLSPEAAAVVDDPRIALPDSALWDIYRGDTTETMLELMATLAEKTPYAAVVLNNGHPYNVFETDRVSNHSRGRAIDIYLIGDQPVIDSHSRDSLAHEIAAWAATYPDTYELGSPWVIGGATANSFTNTVHHDHIHIGVRG
jgi:hypothetical protein